MSCPIRTMRLLNPPVTGVFFEGEPVTATHIVYQCGMTFARVILPDGKVKDVPQSMLY